MFAAVKLIAIKKIEAKEIEIEVVITLFSPENP